MTTQLSKVKFGLKNVHVATVTESGGKITYGVPKAIQGAVSVSLTAAGDLYEFVADDITYFSSYSNNGYDGELEIADIPEWFSSEILGDEVVDGVQFESSEQQSKKFAMTFEVSTDKKPKRYLLYYCSASRPNIASTTKGQTIEAQTSSLTFTARPRIDNYLIKANTTATITPEVFNAWNTKIHEKSTVQGA